MSRGSPIQHHILDNECSTAFAKYKIDYQYEHRVNASERAIRTFKNHLIMCPRHWKSSSIPLLISHNMHHMCGLLQCMGRKLNLPLKITHPSLTKMKPPEFKSFLVHFYIVQGLSTPQSYLLLMKFLLSIPNPQRKQPKLANNSWSTYLPILKQSSSTMQSDMVLSLISDAAYLSSLMPEVAVLCYTLSPMLPLPNHCPSNPMGLSMYWSRPSMVFLLQPLRLRQAVSSSVPKRLSLYSTH